jgi:hypothetical protein
MLKPAFRMFALSLASILLLSDRPADAVVLGGEAPALAANAVMILGSKGSFCTGAVVSRNAVLTAGHCVTGSSDYRVHWKDATGQPVLVPPKAIAVHPQFDKGAVQGRRKSVDMALVRLAESLPSSFAPLPLGAARPAKGEAWTVAGYGLGVEGDPRTSGAMRQAGLSVIEPFGPSSILVWLTDPQTGRERSGSGACTGDSGGLVLDGTGALGAVIVWAEGVGKSRCGALTQGVLVGPQRGWIDGVLAGWR